MTTWDTATLLAKLDAENSTLKGVIRAMREDRRKVQSRKNAEIERLRAEVNALRALLVDLAPLASFLNRENPTEAALRNRIQEVVDMAHG